MLKKPGVKHEHYDRKTYPDKGSAAQDDEEAAALS